MRIFYSILAINKLQLQSRNLEPFCWTFPIYITRYQYLVSWWKWSQNTKSEWIMGFLYIFEKQLISQIYHSSYLTFYGSDVDSKQLSKWEKRSCQQLLGTCYWLSRVLVNQPVLLVNPPLMFLVCSHSLNTRAGHTTYRLIVEVFWRWQGSFRYNVTRLGSPPYLITGVSSDLRNEDVICVSLQTFSHIIVSLTPLMNTGSHLFRRK